MSEEAGTRMLGTIIGRAFGGDIAAIKEEIQSHTIKELVEKYHVSHGAVSGWVSALHVYCARECKKCNEKKRAKQMILNVLGHPSNCCIDCADAEIMEERERERKKKQAQAAKSRKQEASKKVTDEMPLEARAVMWPMDSGVWDLAPWKKTEEQATQL